MTTLQELQESIQEFGLANHMDALLKLAKPAIQIKPIRVSNENEIDIGQSKMGGSPDLPQGTAWPYWEDKPLTFMGQFRLEDIVPFDSGHELPHDGMLYFFYEADSQPWGFTPSDKNSGKILFLENNSTPLARIPHPTAPGEMGEIKSLNPCEVQIFATLTMPSIEFIDLSKLGFTEPELEKYGDVLGAITPNQTWLNWLLGYPHEIQGDMRLECQLASNGIYVGNASGYEHPRFQELEKGSSDWKLLFQVDSDDALGIMWGDVGIIYYWIKQQDLKMSKFDNIWLILQCT